MALDKDRWGQNVADAIAAVGITAGPLITPGQLALIWKTVKQEDKTEFNDHADIELDSADVDISAGTFTDSLSQPVTGKGINDSVTLTQKIK